MWGLVVAEVRTHNCDAAIYVAIIKMEKLPSVISLEKLKPEWRMTTLLQYGKLSSSGFVLYEHAKYMDLKIRDNKKRQASVEEPQYLLTR